MKKTKKPNILIFMTDQHRYEALGCHGNKILKTPNIDKLAAGGIDFQRCYSQSAICMPSRVTLLTGQYLHTHGIMANSKYADVSRLTTLPKLLKNECKAFDLLASQKGIPSVSAPRDRGLFAETLV